MTIVLLVSCVVNVYLHGELITNVYMAFEDWTETEKVLNMNSISYLIVQTLLLKYTQGRNLLYNLSCFKFLVKQNF